MTSSNMEKTGLVKQLLIAGIVVIIVAGSILALNFLSEKEGKDPDDIDETNHDDTPDDEPDDIQPIPYHALNVTLLDAYTTDKIDVHEDPDMGSGVFLVLNISILNDMDVNLTIIPCDIQLIGPEGRLFPILMYDFLGDAFEDSEMIPQGSSSLGLLHYLVQKEQKWSNITYKDHNRNVTFVVDLDLEEIEFRPWKTPLLFEITGCGREPNGSGKEQYLYFDLWVRNPSKNNTYFQCWIIDLMCHNGVKLDGLFVPEPTAPFPPGGNVTYRIYFDINWGSPEKPKTLYESLEGMYIDIDEGMYEGLI